MQHSIHIHSRTNTRDTAIHRFQKAFENRAREGGEGEMEENEFVDLS